MKIIWNLFLLLGFVNPYIGQAYEAEWNQILKEIVNSEGLVRYDLLESKNSKLRPLFDQLVKDIQNVSFSSYEGYSKSGKMAYLINAYNILTLKLILDHPGLVRSKISVLFLVFFF